MLSSVGIIKTYAVDLLQLVGLSVASAVAKEYADKQKRVLVVCGPGNNGMMMVVMMMTIRR